MAPDKLCKYATGLIVKFWLVPDGTLNLTTPRLFCAGVIKTGLLPPVEFQSWDVKPPALCQDVMLVPDVITPLLNVDAVLVAALYQTSRFGNALGFVYCHQKVAAATLLIMQDLHQIRTKRY